MQIKNTRSKSRAIVGLLLYFFVGACAAEPWAYDVESAISDAASVRKSYEQNNEYMSDLPGSKYARSLNKINNTLNQEWGLHSEDEGFAEYLLALWENREAGLRSDGWSEVNHPIVRTEIARILGQASRKCLVDLDIEELRAYVLKNAESSNAKVRLVAVSALGSVGQVEDIDYLADIVTSENPGWAENAVQALRMLRRMEAIEKLFELRGVVQRESLREFIDNILSDYGPGFRGFIDSPCK